MGGHNDSPDSEYQKWLDDMVRALRPVKRETVQRLACVEKALRSRWGVPVQRSS